MTDKIVNTTIEILGKYYPVRCQEAEVAALQQAAKFLNSKMEEVQESGKVINLERIAIITALNVAHQFLQIDSQKSGMMDKINQRISEMHKKLEKAMTEPLQAELIYSQE